MHNFIAYSRLRAMGFRPALAYRLSQRDSVKKVFGGAPLMRKI